MGRLGARTTVVVLLAVLGSLVLVGPVQARAGALERSGSRVTYHVTGGGRILVTARARPCRGFPKLRIRVDGRLDRTVRPTRRGAQTYRTTRAYAPGPHSVTVVMRADRTVRRGAARCDRRIRVLGVRTAPPMPAPARPGRHFTLAVIGDTQAEVLGGRSTFATRTAWLAAHRAHLGLAFVAQTGDLVNWGWLDQAQWDAATAAMSTLTAAGIPWQAAAGNHDTAAVGWDGIAGSTGYGGSAYASNPECPARLGADRCRTQLLVRDTSAFDERVGAMQAADVAGTFRGGLENSYSRFTAAGRSWLVLTLELWPRQEALTWARGVLAAHRGDNAIILTHDYLRGNATVSVSASYGSLPATEIYRQLVAPYPNVSMVLSGHEGLAARRIDRPAGHQVVAFLGNESKAVAVTRLIDIDADNGVVASRWWAGTVALDGPPTGATRDTGFTFR